jgi:hypothetical protein
MNSNYENFDGSMIKDYYDSEEPVDIIVNPTIDKTLDLGKIPTPDISEEILDVFYITLTNNNILFQSDKSSIISKSLRNIYRSFMDNIERCSKVNYLKKLDINIFNLIHYTYKVIFNVVIKKTDNSIDLVVSFNSLLYLNESLDYKSYYENKPINGDENHVENIIFLNLFKYCIVPAIQTEYPYIIVKFINEIDDNLRYLFYDYNINSKISYYDILVQSREHIKQKYITLKTLIDMFNNKLNILSIFNLPRYNKNNKYISYLILDIIDSMNDDDKSHFIIYLSNNYNINNKLYIELFTNTILGKSFQPYKYMDIDYMNPLFESSEMILLLNVIFLKLCASSLNDKFISELFNKKIFSYITSFGYVDKVVKKLKIKI